MDRSREIVDPDAALAQTDGLRKLRVQLTQIEEQLEISSTGVTFARRMSGQVRYIERMIHTHGMETEKADFIKLNGQYQRYAESNDTRGLKWVQEQLWQLHWNVVNDQVWYWQNRLENLKVPGRRFLNKEEATKCIQAGDAANQRGDLPALRNAVFKAWSLMPPDQFENAKQQESAFRIASELSLRRRSKPPQSRAVLGPYHANTPPAKHLPPRPTPASPKTPPPKKFPPPGPPPTHSPQKCCANPTLPAQRHRYI